MHSLFLRLNKISPEETGDIGAVQPSVPRGTFRREASGLRNCSTWNIGRAYLIPPDQ